MLLNLCEILAWCTKTFGKDCRYSPNPKRKLVMVGLLLHL